MSPQPFKSFGGGQMNGHYKVLKSNSVNRTFCKKIIKVKSHKNVQEVKEKKAW